MGFPDKPEGHTNTAVWTQLKVKGHCKTQLKFIIQSVSPPPEVFVLLHTCALDSNVFLNSSRTFNSCLYQSKLY